MAQCPRNQVAIWSGLAAVADSDVAGNVPLIIDRPAVTTPLARQARRGARWSSGADQLGDAAPAEVHDGGCISDRETGVPQLTGHPA